MCEYNKKNAWRNNVEYFYNLCESLSTEQTLIYASSSSVYGRNPNISREEDININPINHYDLTKITIDLIANKFIGDGKNIIGLRFGTVNGASINTRSDLMLNSMILSFKTNGHIKTKNDWVKRPILGIEDLTSGIVSILKSKLKQSGQYNMCSFNTTVREAANKVSAKTGCDIIKTEDDNNFYDFQIDSSKFERTFNYKFVDTIDTIIESLLHSDVSEFKPRNDDKTFNTYEK
jgi:nucleoside-diphosphate-sugar epimerase